MFQSVSAQTTLTETQQLECLRLFRTQNVGPITYRQLLQNYGSAAAALDALPGLAKRGGRSLHPPAKSTIEAEYAATLKMGGAFVFLGTTEYPEALAVIEDAPPVLSVLGHLSLLRKKSIGIVGARNASLNGHKMAGKLAQELGGNGLVVVSGLARGIDTAAHTASLHTGTVAAVAGGVDTIYPEENRGLHASLCEMGAIVSEQPLSTQAEARLFPRRNRIISGLSLGVVVVEAALQSGSLITARMALEQGREVFAVPGSPLDPRASGPNDLLRQGAILTESAADILHHISSLNRGLDEKAGQSNVAFMPVFRQMPTEDELTTARVKILENLNTCPVLVDELVRQCQSSPEVVLTVLLELELAGKIVRQPGQLVAVLG